MSYHLLLIDGLNLLRRCYEANPAPDSAAKAESAVSVAHHSFQRALRDHAPSHCLAVFDAGGPTWRHALFADYKADRKPMSPYLAYELASFKERLMAEHWAVMSVPGEEADDTLWGLAKAARFEGESVTVLSTDKDMARLVAIGAKVYHHFDRKWHDEAWCKAVCPSNWQSFAAASPRWTWSGTSWWRLPPPELASLTSSSAFRRRVPEGTRGAFWARGPKFRPRQLRHA